MDSGNQNPRRKNEGHGNNNGGSQQRASNLADRVKDAPESVSARLREGVSNLREELVDPYKRAGEVISRNPATSLFIGLGIGFGLGLVLSTTIGRREETWADRNLPDSLRDFPGHLQQSRFAQSLRSAPEAFHSSFGHIAETLRDLPSAIARAMPKH